MVQSCTWWRRERNIDLYCVSLQCHLINQWVIYDINFIYINIFYLLIKIYLFLIFIKYFINEFRINIKLLG
jgi:hypothetical protein